MKLEEHQVVRISERAPEHGGKIATIVGFFPGEAIVEFQEDDYPADADRTDPDVWTPTIDLKYIEPLSEEEIKRLF